MSIKSILDQKGSRTVTMPPETKVGVAAHRMRAERIGALVISRDGSNIDGIVSERDIVNGMTEYGAAVIDLPVSELMSKAVRTCRPDSEMREVMHLMTLYRIRHLPVTDKGVLCGIVSIGDVVKNRLADMELEAGVMHDYIAARR
jgi:CBS domain-containing protein